MHAYSHIHTRIHIYIHTYILHAYMHTYIPTHTYTPIRTYMHTYTHTYIHTRVQAIKGGKGVDSTASTREAQDMAIALATHYKCVVVVSGEVDIITDGQ